MRGKESPNLESPFSELATVKDKVKESLSGVEPLASRQVDQLLQPLPEGFDYLSSSFFILACRSYGLMSKGVLSFACAIEALSMAFKALLSLMDLKETRPSPVQDHRHAEGMTLLLADGLILQSYKFLTELNSKELRLLAPILVGRTREWTGKIDSWENQEEGLVDLQRSLSAMAIQALQLLVENTDDSMKVVKDLAVQTDRLLSKYRNFKDENERRSVVNELEELSRSLLERGKWCLPLCHYISLVGSSLTLTSPP